MNALNDRFKAAYDALVRGDLGSALAQGQAVLKAQPRNPAVLQFLGVVCAQAGDAARGADYFRQAIAHGGDTIDNRVNLAKALLALGRADEAAALCDDPKVRDHADMQRLRAEIFKAQGQSGEAVWVYEGLTAANPQDFEAWNNLGNARLAQGDLENALIAFQQARALRPQSPLVHLNMGRTLLALDRHQDACFVFEEAHKLDPRDPIPLLELGRTFCSLDHAEAALPPLGTAARLNPQDPEIFLAIGIAFTDLANLSQAEQAYRFAIKARPGFGPAWLNLGILLERDNRIEELDQLIADADAAGARGGEIDYLRALSLRRQGRLDEALDLARAIDSDAIDRTMVEQFIGEAADRLGRTDEAAAAFAEMNRAAALSPLGQSVDRGAYQRDIERIEALTTPEFFARWADAPPIDQPPAPAFLVGFPRSGTTLLDTILMGHSRTHVLEEVPILDKVAAELGDFTRLAEIGPEEIARLRALYFAELDKVSPPPAGALVIDKNPLSMLRVPLIHRLFPDARIILAMRHPADVVLSCYMQNFKPTEAMSSFLDLTNASRTYDRIFRYWETCRAIFPIRVETIRYEDLVADTEGAVRPIVDFLGLDWEGQALDHQRTAIERGHIRTPSYAQVTEKVYARASGRWTRYREPMKYALPVLAPWAERYGYSLE
ncbi:tetratricopeptide repeat-containing sulfotransferase family protein [Rhizorhabdus dicambivorans]|uniref:Sulfotransferase n=1 Tax=Rhizorhabdus dicambivorans TaxID=1850238 RepID=A0A2A4G1J7_9SPHN|nr:tetratricopeptide repeat-containing sulfotransferase family protein [Rhizorhabdus dicambivorans]ATE63438.1 sulfotransferase [Rhizorhabdus dicambivorans]PCE43657.1 sulfotransferase [Rhizorhabdus dicambivorans]